MAVRAVVALTAVAAPMGATGGESHRLYFGHYDIKNGLSQNTVHCSLQDRQGFLWFGTKDGLNRFDGVAFKNLSENTPEGERCSFVSALYEDGDGLIWVGGHNGAFIYDPVTERLTKFDVKTAEGHEITTQVQQFTVDGKGNIILVIDTDGVYCYEKKSGRLTALHNRRDPAVGLINRVAYDPTGRAWIGSFGRGLFYSDDNMKTIRRFENERGERYFGSAIVNDIVLRGDKIYVATEREGLHVIDVHTGVGKPVFVTDERGEVPYMRKLMFYGGSEVWIASESGLYVYDIVKNELTSHLTHNYFDKYSISDNAIYSLLADRDGGVWVGSYFGGVDYLDNNMMMFDKFYPDNSEKGLRGQRIREICGDPATGKIYVGSEDNGLSCHDPATGSFERVAGVGEKNIHGLCIDGRNLWVGTFSQGLKVKNLDTGAVKEYRAGTGCRLVSDYVFSIIRTIHGDLLAGTLSGLQRYNRETDSFEDIDELHNYFIYDVMEDSEGGLWAATYSSGLFHRRGGETKWRNYQSGSDEGGLPSDKVYGVYEDMGKNVWVMTQNGLCVYNRTTERFDRRFLGVDRIKGVVYQVVEDDYGRYWLTTNHGLYCLDKKSEVIRRFSTSDGLPTDQFNYSSSLKTAGGKIYLGTIDGLVAFEPLKFSFNSNRTSPRISELFLHGKPVKPGEEGSPLKKSITMTDRLDLKSYQNSLAMRIVTLRYAAPGSQRIKYMLEGLDKEWHYTTPGEAIVSYPNLDYGSYTLKVAAYNEHDEDAIDMLELKINIATPIYASWWAILIYVLLAAGIIYYIFYQYKRYSQLNNQRAMENYKQEKEREAYDSKIKFFTNVAHEIRTPLTLIKAPLDSVSKADSLAGDNEVKENLDVINLNVDRLLLLANQLLDFRKMESGKFQINKQRADVKKIVESCVTRFMPTVESAGKRLEISLPEGEVEAVVDAEAITKIVSNLFTNAIKYGKSYIRVALTMGEGNFRFEIANDGEVVAPDKREEIFTLFTRLGKHQQNVTGTGLGLAYARSLAQMHEGTLAMGESTVENVFVLTVPTEAKADAVPEKDSVENLEHMLKRNEERVSILLVDDNMEMLNFIEKKLIAQNYRVIKAGDGREALKILANEYVDIVVSDVMMPEIDGMELVKRLKSDVNYSHIPVILLTAKTRMEDKLTGLESGADAYIEKPFAVEYLIANIAMLLRNRERMRHSLESMPLTKVSGKGLTKVDEEFLRKINEIIQGNFNNPDFSMEDVISAMGMSRTTFYRKIKGLLDLNPNDYIKMERLKRAAQLFNEGHVSVSEVCYMVGFSSPGYFTKCFQKQFGMSPKEYISSLMTGVS